MLFGIEERCLLLIIMKMVTVITESMLGVCAAPQEKESLKELPHRARGHEWGKDT